MWVPSNLLGIECGEWITLEISALLTNSAALRPAQSSHSQSNLTSIRIGLLRDSNYLILLSTFSLDAIMTSLESQVSLLELRSIHMPLIFNRAKSYIPLRALLRS